MTAVADELARTLDFFKVPEREKGEVLAAFAAHKGEVNEGYTAVALDRVRVSTTACRDRTRRLGTSPRWQFRYDPPPPAAV